MKDDGTQATRTGISAAAGDSAGEKPRARRPSTLGPISPGMEVGRYQVLSVLGRGGMGVVYKAYDPQLDRGVALKLMKPGSNQGKAGPAAARLLREAQALAQLSHPNVVAVHDVGTVDDQVFVAMELVEGETLRQWLAADPPPTQRDITAVFAAVATGLAAAHDAGLVHRDVKPDNLIIGADGRARIIDFGLARVQSGAEDSAELRTSSARIRAEHSARFPASPARGAEPALDACQPAVEGAARAASPPVGSREAPGPQAHDAPNGEYVALTEVAFFDSQVTGEGRRMLDTPVTQHGAVLGTPCYMAPEQHLKGEVDGRADQFSFSLALYEALSGVRAVRNDEVRRILRAAVAEEAGASAPPWPPPHPAHVPAWLQSIVDRGLALEPDARFGSMHEIAAALGKDRDAVRRVRRRWLMAAAALAVVAVLPFVVWRGMQADAAQLCVGARAELAGVWDPASRAATEQVFASSGSPVADEAWQRVAVRLDRYADEWSQMHESACAATRIAGSQSEEMLDLRMLCLDGRRRDLRALVGLLQAADAAVVRRSAQAVYALAPISACGDLAGLVATSGRLIEPPDASKRAEVAAVRDLVSQVRAMSATGRQRDGLGLAQQSLAAARAIGYEPLLAEAYFWLAMIERTMDEHESAAAHFDLAYTSALAVGDFELSARAVNRQSFVVGYGLGRVDDGLRLARLAGALIQRQQGDRALAEALRESNLGILHGLEGDHDGALRHQTRALEIRERALGPDHPEVAVCLHNLGIVLHEQGRLAEAMKLRTRAVEIFESAYGPRHPKVLWGLTNMAESLRQAGDHDRARASYQRVLSGFAETMGERFPGAIHPLKGLAALEQAGGNEVAARAIFERIETLCEAVRCHAPTLAEVRVAFANSLARTGDERDRERAAALAREARAVFVDSPGKQSQLDELDAWLHKLEAARAASSVPMR